MTDLEKQTIQECLEAQERHIRYLLHLLLKKEDVDPDVIFGMQITATKLRVIIQGAGK